MLDYSPSILKRRLEREFLRLLRCQRSYAYAFTFVVIYVLILLLEMFEMQEINYVLRNIHTVLLKKFVSIQ